MGHQEVKTKKHALCPLKTKEGFDEKKN